MSRRSTRKTPLMTKSTTEEGRSSTAASSMNDATAGSIRSTTLMNRKDDSYSEIHDYLLSQKYPLGFTKVDKLVLRKRAKYFKIDNGQLYYTGRGMYNFIYIATMLIYSEGLNVRNEIGNSRYFPEETHHFFNLPSGGKPIP